MKRIAVIGPIYTNLSQVQQIADRFLVGYPYRGSWRHPDMKVVSLYIHQKAEGDLSQERAREFGFQVFTSVAQALRCGGGKLAVDAVLIAAGHGDRAPNEFFKAFVDVFEQEGRSVPVYNDMRLSSGFEKTAWMVDQSKRLRFPLLAGSPLPVTWRLPELELPIGCEIEEALTI